MLPRVRPGAGTRRRSSWNSPSGSGFPCTWDWGGFFRGRRASNRERARRASRRFSKRWWSWLAIGSGIGAPALLWVLADSLRTVGRHDEALSALGVGVARAEQQGQDYYDAELHRLRAEILLEKDGNAVEEAEALFGRSLEIARRQEAKTFELRAATSLARLWQRQGKRDAARALLAPIYAWFTEGFATRDLKDAKALLDDLT